MSKNYKPFPAVVCQRIRNLIAKWGEVEAERKRMFEARDEAKGQLQRLTDGEAAKRQKLEADVGRAVIEIEILAKSDKWCKSELIKTAKGADEPGLFDDADIEMPSFTADSGEGDAADGNDDEPGVQPATDVRPVGRPDGAAPPAADAPAPAGVDGKPAAKLDLKFPGRFTIVHVAADGPLRETGLVGMMPCGDRERLDYWIEQVLRTDRFTLSADGIVTSNDVRRLHVTRMGDVEDVAAAPKTARPSRTRKGAAAKSGPKGKRGKKAVHS